MAATRRNSMVSGSSSMTFQRSSTRLSATDLTSYMNHLEQMETQSDDSGNEAKAWRCCGLCKRRRKHNASEVICNFNDAGNSASGEFSDDEENSDTEYDDWELDDSLTGRNRNPVGLRGESQRISANRAKRMRTVSFGDEHVDTESGSCSCLLMERVARQVERKRFLLRYEEPAFPAIASWTKSVQFEACVASVVLFNILVMGTNTYYDRLSDRPASVETVERFFLVFYMIEWVMRIVTGSWVWFCEAYNLFDTLIIFGSVLLTFVLEPLGFRDFESLRVLIVARVIRMLSVIRAFRLLPAFACLWKLVQGLSTCLIFIMGCLFIIGTVHFVFAVATIEIISRNPVFLDDERVQEAFGTLASSMWTLFQLMMLDTWAIQVRHIIKKTLIGGALIFLFIGIASIVLLTLVKAIVIRRSTEMTTADVEAREVHDNFAKAKKIACLMKMFKELDCDGGGTLTVAEFTNVLSDISFLRTIKRLHLDIEELPDVFEILDDGDGEVTSMEFCHGLMKMEGPAMGLDILGTCKHMVVSSLYAVEIFDFLDTCSDRSLETIEHNVVTTRHNIQKAHFLVSEILEATEQVGIQRLFRSTIPGIPKVPSEPLMIDLSSKEAAEVRARAPVGTPLVTPFKEGCVPVPPMRWSLERMIKKREEMLKKQSKGLAIGSRKPNSKRSEMPSSKRRGTAIAWGGWCDKLSLDISRFSKEALKLEHSVKETMTPAKLSVQALPGRMLALSKAKPSSEPQRFGELPNMKSSDKHVKKRSEARVRIAEEDGLPNVLSFP
eukprot:TRINITY_DN76265_c0_g1_i1.p1 TRINITY_DN76265_c0_g1~~TRINITY_DN76265_c0_g1_i1.p1  ORF type:complete len:780 (+),score=136.40 TRINITY_DN76265_c0_g1_i1:78-2417(+)